VAVVGKNVHEIEYKQLNTRTWRERVDKTIQKQRTHKNGKHNVKYKVNAL
jgi:hypothetical protein